MSPDEPLALEPARGLSPLARSLAIGAGAFALGVAGTAGVIWMKTAPAPKAVVPPAAVAQPQAAPAPALPPATDVATLSARETLLAGRLDQLELRLRSVDSGARTAAAYATQAERLMIAFSARRAIERGMPLGPLAAQLRARFGEAHPDAVGSVIQAADQPVTLEDLRLALDTLAPRLTVAPNASLWSRVGGLFGDLVVLRQSDSPSPRPADRLRRARRTLEEGQVEAALAEVARLPGAVAAESWVDAAKRYIGARAALREIEAAAMETPSVPASTPAGG
jgi:hypothetical protein